MRGDTQQQLADALAAWGQTLSDAPAAEMLVWPENHAAVQLFVSVQSCWRKTVVASMAGAQVLYDGLDYAQVKVLMEMLFADVDAQDTFARLLVMEREAVSLLNQKA